MKQFKIATLMIVTAIILAGGFLILLGNTKSENDVENLTVSQIENNNSEITTIKEGEEAAPLSKERAPSSSASSSSSSSEDGSIKVNYSPSKKIYVFLSIDFGEGTLQSFATVFREDYTVFDLLKEASEKQGFLIKSKNYDIGVFVEAINGIEGGQDNKYWQYYVNGETPMVAADKYYLKARDKVEFKFEKSKF